MATIGEQFREAREAKGLSIEDAHRSTKIHVRVLKAMEEDRTSELLDPTYAKVFLKKYANFLELDPQPIIEAYLNAEPPTPRVPLSIREQAEPETAPEPAGPGRWLIPGVITLTAIVGAVFIGFLAKDLYRTVTPAGAPSKASSAEVTKASQPKKMLVPKSKPLRLKVAASQDCWMQVKVDGKVLFQAILKEGQNESWEAKEGVELWVGNAAALSLSLNGRALDPLGFGVKKGILVTHEGLTVPKKP